MTSAISEMRIHCAACNRNAPSQPSAPPTPPIQPQYPFQCICADFFNYAGHNYFVIVDRYSNWPIVERAHDGSKGLISTLRQTFTTFGISDELMAALSSHPQLRQHFCTIGELITAFHPWHSPTTTAGLK